MGKNQFFQVHREAYAYGPDAELLLGGEIQQEVRTAEAVYDLTVRPIETCTRAVAVIALEQKIALCYTERAIVGEVGQTLRGCPDFERTINRA